MGKLVLGSLLLLVALLLRLARAGMRDTGRPAGGLLRIFSLGFTALGAILIVMALVVVIDPGQVGVKHAFGTVDRKPLLPGIHLVAPWSSIERYSTREEQFPRAGDEVEEIAALSSEQMGMTVDAGLRWQINPMDAPRIFTEIGTEEQIHSIVLNAIRKGVRDGMVQFSINDIAKRTEIANTMQALVDSALVTQPREGGEPFRIAEVTAFFLRDLQPPAAVVQAINNKIAQEQQIQTERHRVEVARLQSEQQRLLNQTLTAEALTKQYLEVLHDMKGSGNLVLLIPTEGGVPMLDLAKLRDNLGKR
ncbi:MAG TPA: SPFH domain-containing protein [Gemmatimonadales bacterium]|jgi:regulator of protease activity HflC (stomatin/prohibitin superfamily)|nr:SPFH domain-containing protein [Gemmatimonadales bacterium]